MPFAVFCDAKDRVLQGERRPFTRRRPPFRGAATAFKDDFCAFFDANGVNVASHMQHSLHLNSQKPYKDKLFHGKPL